MKDAELVKLCRVAGFDPDDSSVWSWWTRWLNDADRKELAGAMDRGKMPTFTDLGIRDIQANARPRR
jgi:hypothetical protein